MTHLERLRDERGFIHRSGFGRALGGIVSGVVGAIPVVGGVIQGIQGVIQGFGGADTVPQATGCPPGFIRTAAGCAPTGTIAMERRGSFASRARERIVLGSVPGVRNGGPPPSLVGPLLDPFATGRPSRVNGGPIDRPEIPTLAVTGQFGAGFEASIVSRELRLCPPKTVLGVDGVCYNRRDLRNDERAWPRGRRPLMTGGDVRAISIANRAATRLQKKQKQLEDMGMLKKKVCPKPKQLLPGHVAQLAHASEHN